MTKTGSNVHNFERYWGIGYKSGPFVLWYQEYICETMNYEHTGLSQRRLFYLKAWKNLKHSVGFEAKIPQSEIYKYNLH